MSSPGSATTAVAASPTAAAGAGAAPADKSHRKHFTRKSIMEMSSDEKVAKVQALIRGRRTRKKNPHKFKGKGKKGAASIASTLKKDDIKTATAAATPAVDAAKAAADAAAAADPNTPFLTLLNTALATENVDEITAAVKHCQSKDWTKHRRFEEAEKTLKFIKKQIETLKFLEQAVNSRRMVDLEQALNMAEEYDMNRTEEAKEIAKVRDTIAELKTLLENSEKIEDSALIDAALTRCMTTGLILGVTTGEDEKAVAAHNKEYEWVAAAQKRRDVLVLRDKIASELSSVVRSNDLSKLEAMFKKAQENNFPPAHPLYEAAQIKLAELQSNKDGKSAAPSKKAEKKKMDPYSAKAGGARPAVSIQQYAIPKYILHKCPLLRTNEEFAKGVLFNSKRVKAYMLLWQNDVIPRSLTQNDEKKIPKEIIQKTFKTVLGYMGDAAKPEPPLQSDQNVIELMKLGHGREDLRDEIYVQILKQCTMNPKTESTVRGWQMLGLICEAFSPSDTLLPFVYHYIYYNSKPECPWDKYAKYCMYTLHNTVNEPLKPVTDFTMEHVLKFRTRTMEMGKVRIYFLDGSEFDIQVEPHHRVCDSLQTVFDRIKLRDRPGFGIFQVGQITKEVGEGREVWIPLNACLLDYDPQMRPSVSPVLYKQQAARLVFKRRLYTDLTSPDPMAQRLLYYQTLVDICNDNLPVEVETQIKLVALHRVLDAVLNKESIADPNMLSVVAVRNIVPVAIETGTEKKKELYLEKVSKAKSEYATKKPKIDFETLLKEVREHQLFGCQYFTTKALEDRKKEVPKGLMMGISSQGIYLVHGKEKKVFEDYPFFQINRFECVGTTFKLYSKKAAATGTTGRAAQPLQCFVFKTEEADEIAALMTTLLEDIASVSTAE